MFVPKSTYCVQMLNIKYLVMLNTNLEKLYQIHNVWLIGTQKKLKTPLTLLRVYSYDSQLGTPIAIAVPNIFLYMCAFLFFLGIRTLWCIYLSIRDCCLLPFRM